MMCYRTSTLLILLLSLAATAGAQPDPIVDLAAVSPEDGLVRRVYGATGQGNFGLPVAGGYDVDGDGLVDYAVAFFLSDPSGVANAGEVDLIFGDGTTGGFVDTAVDDPAVLRFVGSQVLELAGSEIWMDDVTGDGLGDLLICRQNFTPDPWRIGAGALTVVAGSAALRAQAASFEAVDLAAPPAGITLTTLVGAAQLDRLGIWVRTGDVTGDGIADLVVGADQEDLGGETNRGAVYVVRGGPHLAAGGVIDLALSPALPGHLAKITPPAGSGGHHFGATNQIADLDGNGRAEVLVAATVNRAGAGIEAAGAPAGSAEGAGGAPGGALYIVWDDNFPTGAWPDGYTIDLSAAPGARTVIHGEDANVSFGEEILGGLDFDGDGAADLFVGDLVGDGSPAQDRAFSGFGHLLYGAAALKGLDLDLDDPLPPGVRATRILGPSAGAIGADTAAQGDFDGDGYSDLAFTSPHADPAGRANAGAVHVLYGRPGGWPATVDLAAGALPPASEVRIAEIQGARANAPGDVGDTLGYSAAAADVNGDGLSDLIVNEMVGNGLTPGTVDVGNLIVVSGVALGGSPSCSAGATALCLNDSRFLVEAFWQTPSGAMGEGQARMLTSDSGYFWFFSADNVEVVVKALDACDLPPFHNFWIFASGLTDVEVTLRVTDTVSTEVREYFNPLGTPFQPILDTDAFDTCLAVGGS